MTVTVIIPAYKPDEKFRKLLEGLQEQTYPPEQILIMNTEEKYWEASFLTGISNARVVHIKKEEFDHGGTRDRAARMVDSAILAFFTQDAVLADKKVLEKLVSPFADGRIAAVYGRQLPNEDCSIVEKYTRAFNYPEKSRRKTKEDLEELGIKTFFCSNVCAAYRNSIYKAMGGFVRHTIFNEDMIMAGNMIKAGYDVYYAADARVIHSHNYSWREQFRRNFDLGVSQADHPEIFQGVPSEGEGIRLVKNTMGYLMKIHKPWLIPGLIVTSGFKFLGYRAGKKYYHLPKFMIRKFTMNLPYWEKQ